MQVKVCVDCGEEYRPDITACADCGGQLEVRTDDGERIVPPKPPSKEDTEEPEADFAEAILHADRAGDLRSEADRLVEAGIDFRLRAARTAGYNLLVTAEDRERALALLGLLADVSAVTGEGRSCPACGIAVEPNVAECPDCGLAVGDEPESEEE